MNEKVLAEFREQLFNIYSEFVDCLSRQEKCSTTIIVEKAVIQAAESIRSLDELVGILAEEEGERMKLFEQKVAAQKETLDQTIGLVERLKKRNNALSEIISKIDQTPWENRIGILTIRDLAEAALKGEE